MLRAALVTLLIAFHAPSLTGEWSATVMTPRGNEEFTMYLNQEGPRLSGYFQSQYGEIPLKGTINGSDIRLAWSFADAGKTIDVTMVGTVSGESANLIKGEATLGGVGKGPFTAERAASGPTD